MEIRLGNVLVLWTMQRGGWQESEWEDWFSSTSNQVCFDGLEGRKLSESLSQARLRLLLVGWYRPELLRIVPHPGRRFFSTVGGARSNTTAGGPGSDRIVMASDGALREALSLFTESDISAQSSGRSSERVVIMCLMNVS